MYAVDCEKVSFAYSTERIFNHLTFRVCSGDFVALVGPNGAGKSTLIKLCIGLLQPTCGHINILGEPLTATSAKAKIGYVPQNSIKDRSFPVTVEEVVAMGRTAVLGMGRFLRKTDHEIIDNALKLVDVSGLRKRKIGELSGGQQQRVLLARALAVQPKLLVLDEPTAGIDATAKESIYKHLKNLNQDLGLTILMVSHDVERVAQYANQIASIQKGLKYYGASCDYCKATANSASAWTEDYRLEGLANA